MIIGREVTEVDERSVYALVHAKTGFSDIRVWDKVNRAKHVTSSSPV